MKIRAERIYQRLLALLPSELRSGFEEEMTHLFLMRLQGAQGPLAKLTVWLRALGDLLVQGAAGRMAPSKEAGRREAGASPLRALAQDLRYSARTLRRSPSFTFTAALTLALGIGGTTVAFTLVNGVLLRPLPFPEDGELVSIRELGPEGQSQTLSFPNYDDFRTQTRAFSGIAALRFAGGSTILGGEEPTRGVAVPVSREFFSLMGVPPILGRPILPEENRQGGEAVAVVAYEFWARNLGSEESLESLRITIEGTPYSVVGVMPPGFKVLEEADVYLPLEQNPFMVRSSSNYRAIGRLAPGATLIQARVELEGLVARIQEAYPEDARLDGVILQPLREVLLGDLTRPLFLLLGASAVLLLLACSNVASTLMARSIRRQREMAVRTALGGGRGALVRLALTESVLLALISGLAGVGLTFGALEILKSLGAGFIPRLATVSINGPVLAFALGATLLTPAFFGVLPALRVPEPATALRSGSMGNTRGKGGGGWSLLVGGQVALAVTLVVASGLLIRSMREVLNTETNIRQEGILTLALDLSGEEYNALSTRALRLRELKEELASLPGVREVGLVTSLPNVRPLMTGAIFEPPMPAEGLPEVLALEVGWRVVDEDYFRAMGIPLRKGRTFTTEDGPESPPVIVLNEAVERILFPDGESLGSRVQFVPFWENVDLEVVGVVAEARDWRVPRGEQREAYVFWPQRLNYSRQFTAVIHTDGDPGGMVPAVRDRLRALAPNLPGTFSTMEGRLADSIRDRVFTLWILSGFAFLSLFLSAVGIFGVVSYTVSSRGREIGIMLALGAGRRTVRTSLFLRSARPVVVGLGVGAAAALLAGGVMESLLYQVSPRDPVALILAPMVLLVAAAIAIVLPVFRFTRVDPAGTMREE